MNNLFVKLKNKTYTIFVGLKQIKLYHKIISDANSNVLYLIDKNVYKKCSSFLNNVTIDQTHTYKLFLTCTENNKSLKTIENICEFLFKNNFDKKSVIVAIGGGILGDIAGLTASIYMRGIKYYQLPTTILSAVDSSVGGKTGVNFNQIKNLIGTFYQPDGVFIFPEFFKTLPQIEILSGIGELIKYSIIIPDLYDFYLTEIKKVYYKKIISQKLITTSIKIKSAIVQKDEKEQSGLRKILNLGHTFAHGFESASNFKLKHGIAVIYGLIAAFLTAEKLKLLNSKTKNKFIEDFYFLLDYKFIKNINSKSVINYMKTDKKNYNGKINLVLPGDKKIFVDFPVNEKIILDSIESLKSILKHLL